MKYILLFLLLASICQAGEFIDTVYSHKFGTNVDCGQDSINFPNNIFGKQSTNGTLTVPAAMQSEVLCLGFDGEIVVGLKNNIITDGDGFDFRIFENAFINPVNSRIFAEPGVVSVSQDGINFIEFPYDYKTLKGCAGVTPTIGTIDSFTQDTISGDAFDLKTINLTWAKYIKIKDISNLIRNDKTHYYYDPIISGFDLDAVAIIHSANNPSGIEFENEIDYSLTNGILRLSNNADIEVNDLLGNNLFNVINTSFLNLNHINSKFQLVKISSNGKSIILKNINLMTN